MALLQRFFFGATAVTPPPLLPLMQAVALPKLAPLATEPAGLEPDASSPTQSGRLQLGQGARLSLADRFEGQQAQVDGQLQGSLRVGSLLIGRHGQVQGPVRCQDAQIRGHFEGELIVRGKLTVFATGHVSGKVRCADIQVWKGGVLEGDVQRSDSAGVSPSLRATRRNRCQALFMPTRALWSSRSSPEASDDSRQAVTKRELS